MSTPDVFVIVMRESTRNARVAKLTRRVTSYSALRLMLVRFTEPGTMASVEPAAGAPVRDGRVAVVRDGPAAAEVRLGPPCGPVGVTAVAAIVGSAPTIGGATRRAARTTIHPTARRRRVMRPC